MRPGHSTRVPTSSSRRVDNSPRKGPVQEVSTGPLLVDNVWIRCGQVAPWWGLLALAGHEMAGFNHLVEAARLLAKLEQAADEAGQRQPAARGDECR